MYVKFKLNKYINKKNIYCIDVLLLCAFLVINSRVVENCFVFGCGKIPRVLRVGFLWIYYTISDSDVTKYACTTGLSCGNDFIVFFN